MISQSRLIWNSFVPIGAKLAKNGYPKPTK